MQRPLPGLERAERADPVAGKGAGLDPRANGRFAQRIVLQGAVGQPHDADEVASAATVVHLPDQCRLDQGPEPGTLLVAPVIEGRGVGDLEVLEEGVHLERRHQVGRQHIAPFQPLEIEAQLGGHPDDLMVARESVRIDMLPEPGERGAHRVPAVLHGGRRPQEVGEPVASDWSAAFDGEIDQQRQLFLGPEPDRSAVGVQERRLAEAANGERMDARALRAWDAAHRNAGGATDPQLAISERLRVCNVPAEVPPVQRRWNRSRDRIQMAGLDVMTFCR